MPGLLATFPELPLLLVVLVAAILFRTVRRIVALAVVGLVVAVLLGVSARSIMDAVVEHLPTVAVQRSALIDVLPQQQDTCGDFGPAERHFRDQTVGVLGIRCSAFLASEPMMDR